MIPRIAKKMEKKVFMIYGKTPQCNVPFRWILLNFLSLSACFKRERESQNGEKIISFYKGWEIDVGPRSDWLTRRSPKFRTETTAKHPIQQMSERKESFQDSHSIEFLPDSKIYCYGSDRQQKGRHAVIFGRLHHFHRISNLSWDQCVSLQWQ